MSREETKEEGSPEVFFPVCRKNLIKRGIANFWPSPLKYSVNFDWHKKEDFYLTIIRWGRSLGRRWLDNR